MALRALFIGGNGIISSASSRRLVERGDELTLLNRGTSRTRPPIDGARHLTGDAGDEASMAAAIGDETFDVVANFRAFTPDQVERDIRLFEGRCRQYVYISSASAYQKPVARLPITESTPLRNPFWQYSRDKIACEDRLMEAYRTDGFPITIVRPSLTYGDSQITLAVNSWTRSYTIIDRMRRGKKVIVPGDGSSLWVITHNSDFAKGLVGLLGHPRAIGHAFHITSEEVMTWDQYYRIAAEAAGTQARIIHIASDFLATCVPEMLGGLVGDKAVSVVFDNSKIKRFVPDFNATMPFAQGIRRTLAWFDADPERRHVDAEADARYDKLIAAYESGMQHALAAFNE